MALAADETVAAKMLLLERKLLNLRPHRPVEDENALPRGLRQRDGGVGPSRRSGFKQIKRLDTHWVIQICNQMA